MPPRAQMVGQRFGRLQILADRDKHGALLGTPEARRVRAICDCGEEAVLNARSVRRGRTTSCGCAQREAASTHGLSGHRLCAVWRTMMARCYVPTTRSYRYYGARGIEVCEEWRGGPEAFVAWALPRWRPGLQIERKDNDAGYSPSNCTFATSAEQVNNRRSTCFLTLGGKRVPLTVAARRAGLDPSTVYQRIRKLGWGDERAVREPCRYAKRGMVG